MEPKILVIHSRHNTLKVCSEIQYGVVANFMEQLWLPRGLLGLFARWLCLLSKFRAVIT